MKPQLRLYEFVEGDIGRRYIIIETYLTSDGLRTRVSNAGFNNLEAAKADLQKRREKLT